MLNCVMPTWRQIFCKEDDNPDGFWNLDNCIYTSSSAVSMRMIFDSCIEQQEKNITVLVPAYFCQETLNGAYTDRVRYLYYPICQDLNPDWKEVKALCAKEHIDVMVFCHYFGMYRDVDRTKNFCMQKKIVLIEDYAHVLYPGKRFGQKGDFVLYSPHKTLPLPDGGILWINRSQDEWISCVQNAVRRSAESPIRKKAYKWRVKKSIQKVIGYQRKIEIDFKPHYGKKKVPDHSERSISVYSKRILFGYTLKMLKQAEALRKDNQAVLDYLMQVINSDIMPAFRKFEGCPYYAVYSFKDVGEKRKAISVLRRKKIMAQYWPDLPEDIRNKEFDAVKELAGNLILVPNHQGIRPSQLAKLVSTRNIDKKGISLKLVSDKSGKREWREVTSQIRLTNIPQDWQYGRVKAKQEHWTVKRFIVVKGEKPIGVLQILVKKVLGFPYIIRINRGPLLIPEFDNIETAVAVLDQLKKLYRFPVLKVAALNIPFSAYSLAVAVKNGWRQWNPYGFSSGVIDLEQTEEDIRKGLNSKWRNQLVSSEKRGLVLKTGKERFEEMIDIYENEQKIKGFCGVPTGILYGLLELKKCPLDILYIESEQEEIIAFDIFYSTSNFGLYLVGWNGEQGRKCYANNFLLYQAALLLKGRGVKWLELGGIDYIETEENALFKSGMNPEMYRLLGEFYSF